MLDEKLVKYADGKFTTHQINKYVIKMFAVLGFNVDLKFAQDDLYTMVLVSIKTIVPILRPHRGIDGEIMNVKWLEDQSLDLLELSYFNHNFLVKILPEVLASAIVLCALTVLT